MGGLGNQLFQYAAARRLSLFHQTELKLDVSSFESSGTRQYALAPFNVVESFATDYEVNMLTGKRLAGVSRLIFRGMQKLKPYYRRRIFAEPHVRPYDASILKTPKDVYLYGYWQSGKYFAGVEEVIKKEFTLKHRIHESNMKLAKQISETESVSVHVRRGDYVSDPGTKSVLGTSDFEYYRASMQMMTERVSNPHFFVFSDDPKWVCGTLDTSGPTTIVSHNVGVRDYEDLYLMSNCKHNILANSTFSWWGAWLNPNPNKIVCAPSQWFRTTDLDARDLVPEEWIKI
jgi:hypothetical protein